MHMLLLGSLTCPLCGATSSPEDTRTNIQIPQMPRTDALYARVGDRFYVTFERIQALGYVVRRPVPPGVPFKLLELWRCPTCNTSDLWAVVEMAPDGDGWSRLEALHAVEACPASAEAVDGYSDLFKLLRIDPLAPQAPNELDRPR